MNDKLKAVLDKIAKLRALAAGATTQGEAEAAAAQAAALIAKYQIDEAQVETSTQARTEEIGEDAPIWEGKRAPSWLANLCGGLAKDHGCHSIYDGNGGMVRFRIAGRPSDVAIVRYLFAWLRVEIERLAQAERGAGAKNAFRNGAALGVLAAMRAARGQEMTSAPHGATTAIAVADRGSAARDFFLALFGKLGKRGAATVSDPAAFRRGHAAGREIAPRNALPSGAHFALGSGR